MAIEKEATLCTFAQDINFYPFKEFQDYNDLQYLMLLTRSFISNDPEEPGILAKWDFSPDGKTFYAAVNQQSKWLDGTVLSSKDAAYSIAKGLSFREIGQRVKVAGTDDINKLGWMEREYEGIKIKSATEFELRFESDIGSLTGTIRDALSTGARHNRIWPARLSKIQNESYRKDFDLISKFPVIRNSGQFYIKYGDILIKMLNFADGNLTCSNRPAFSIFKINPSFASEYTAEKSSASQSIYAFLNQRFKKEQREYLASTLRQAVKTTETDENQVIDSHFMPTELGWDSSVTWPTKSIGKKPNENKIRIATSYAMNPKAPMAEAINAAFEVDKIAVEWKVLDYRNPDPRELAAVDIVFGGGRVSQGRQIWIQDISSNALFQHMLNAFAHSPNLRNTAEALAMIASKSSSTVPVNHEDLRRFNKIVRDEISVVPLQRYFYKYYSRKDLGLKIAPTKYDELSFKKRD